MIPLMLVCGVLICVGAVIMIIVNGKSIECDDETYNKLINVFIENLLGRIEYYKTVIPNKGCTEYRTTLRFGTWVRVGRFKVSPEVHNHIEEALKLLMREELLGVFDQTCRELGIVSKDDEEEEEEVYTPQNSYRTKLTVEE